MGRAHDFQSLFNLPCEYLFSDRMKEFREAAAKRCESVAELFFAGGRRGEYDPRFLDYSLFSHRDADGRTALELFLKEEGLLLPSEEREAIARFRGAAYGLFEIEEVHRRSFRARRAGTDDRFAVKASRERIRLSKPKCGFVGRLVPYGDLHYETGCSIPFAADCVARLDALFRKAGPRALEIYPDPVQFLVGLRRGFLGDSPPRTLPQAEALAAFLFNVAEFPFTVEEVKARFLDLRCPSEIFHGCGLIKVRSPEEFEALTRAIVALWNYTKRSRPGDPAGKEACNHSSPKATTHLVTFEPVDENYGRVRVVSKGDEDSRG